MNKEEELSKKIAELRKEALEIRKSGKNIKQALKLDKEADRLAAKYSKLVNGLTISDHALLRYIERIMGVDVQTIKGNIINKVAKYNFGNGRYPIGDNKYVILKDKTIVTVVEGKIGYKES